MKPRITSFPRVPEFKAPRPRSSYFLRNILLPLGVAVLLGNCTAYVEHKPIRGEAENREATGIRYYRSSPYLLVHSDGKGGIVSRIIFLPDPSKLMQARPVSRFASISTTLEFDRGALKNSEAEIEAGGLPEALVQAIETVLPGITAAHDVLPQGEVHEVPAPLLFKLVVVGKQLVLIGNDTVPNVKVDLAKRIGGTGP